MPNPISATAKALLAAGDARLVNRLWIISELFNADLRVETEVTDYVRAWGILSGDSTLRSTSWTFPGMVLTLRLDDNYLMPGHPDSIWTSLGGADPRKCWVKYTLGIELPDRSVETLRTYYGTIREPNFQQDGDLLELTLTTFHASKENLDAEINKSSGDEVVYRGNDW